MTCDGVLLLLSLPMSDRIREKLQILADAAKYDVSYSSSDFRCTQSNGMDA
jgi:predicted DNA-binding helix-hairpin-helix protein